MSHLVLKKKSKGYQIYDKNKKQFVGKVMNDYTKAQKVRKARDIKEDKILDRKKK